MSVVCPIHQVNWKTVPAGVSKSTGRPYNAFQACPVQGCKERPPKTQSAAPQAPQVDLQTSVILGRLEAKIDNLIAKLSSTPTPPPQNPDQVIIDGIPF